MFSTTGHFIRQHISQNKPFGIHKRFTQLIRKLSAKPQTRWLTGVTLSVLTPCLLTFSTLSSAEPPRTQVFGLESMTSQSATQAARPAIPQGPWYQVELYIFRQPASKSNELWPIKDPIDFASSTGFMTIDPVPMDSGDIPFQQMAMKDIQSYDIGQRLIESRNYEMLYKAAWRQPFVDRATAPTVFISAGNPQASNRRELEGTLRLHKGRYLHVDAHLVLGKYEEHFQEIVATQAQPTDSTYQSSYPSQSNSYDLPETLVTTPGVIALEMFELKESRRMRSGELHYLDHPKFGMLIQINRIKENQG